MCRIEAEVVKEESLEFRRNPVRRSDRAIVSVGRISGRGLCKSTIRLDQLAQDNHPSVSDYVDVGSTTPDVEIVIQMPC